MKEELLELFKTPVTTIKKRAEEKNIKKEAIIALIIAAIIAISSILTTYITITKTVNKVYNSFEDYKKSYSWNEDLTKAEFKKMKKEYKKGLFEDAELIEVFFKTLAITAIAIAVVAGILFVISRTVKSPKEYIEMISMANSAFIIYLAGLIVQTIFSFIYDPIGIIILGGATMFAIIALANAFKESIEVEDTNKLVICSGIVLTIVYAILIILVSNYIGNLFSIL